MFYGTEALPFLYLLLYRGPSITEDRLQNAAKLILQSLLCTHFSSLNSRKMLSIGRKHAGQLIWRASKGLVLDGSMPSVFIHRISLTCRRQTMSFESL